MRVNLSRFLIPKPILMPTEAYHLPNFLTLLPKKPGCEINIQFKAVEAAFNAWVEKKLGEPFAAVCIRCSRLLIHPL